MKILVKDYKLRPVKLEKIESRVQLNPVQYKNVLENCGMKIVSTKIRTVQVPIEGWLDISSFKDFIEGVMPGVKLEIASEALQRGIKETFEELNNIAISLEGNKFDIDFITSISDYQIQLIILGAPDKAGLQEEAGKLVMLSGDLTTLRVEESKNQGVKLAETVASGVTNIFSIFGSEIIVFFG